LPKSTSRFGPIPFSARAQGLVNDVRWGKKFQTDEVAAKLYGRSYVPHPDIQHGDMSVGTQLHGVLRIHG